MVRSIFKSSENGFIKVYAIKYNTYEISLKEIEETARKYLRNQL